jgi:hypothetical protein
MIVDDQRFGRVDAETGEGDERRLNHSDGEAEKFYRELASRRSERTREDGDHRLFLLVRAVTGKTGHRVVNRRCGEDQNQNDSRV